MKNILVAGGNGFIGTHLALSLSRQGHQVIVVDNMLTSRPKIDFWRERNIRFITRDIKNLRFSDFAEPLHQIYNLASVASPPLFQKFGFEIIEAHSVGQRNLLELAKSFNARLLYASSSEVYGEPLSHPQNEGQSGQVSLQGARAYYDESKRFAEVLTRSFTDFHGVSTATARIFNTYGPGMDLEDGRVISEMFRCYLHHSPFTLEGDGHQTRSFCYVDDTVSALELLMESDVTEPINIGNDSEISILELLHTFQSLMKSELVIKNTPLPQNSPTRRRPDLALAKSLLDWAPKVSLHEGLTRMLADYVEHLPHSTAEATKTVAAPIGSPFDQKLTL